MTKVDTNEVWEWDSEAYYRVIPNLCHSDMLCLSSTGNLANMDACKIEQS